MVLFPYQKKRLTISRGMSAICLCGLLGISSAVQLKNVLEPAKNWGFEYVPVLITTNTGSAETPAEKGVGPIEAPEPLAHVTELLPLSGMNAKEIPVTGGPSLSPEEGFTQEDSRGENVLVLELTVSADRIVRDSRILVPSKNELEDFTFAIAAIGSVWPEPLPELKNGETVLRKFKIRYPDANDPLLP